jgi:hypothetical protein
LFHFEGDHTNCWHYPSEKPRKFQQNDAEVMNAISDLLEKSVHYFAILDADNQTQVNESINARMSRFASKNYAWTDSWGKDVFKDSAVQQTF